MGGRAACLDGAARTYEHRDLGVMYHVVTDAAEERTSNGVQTASAHHDQLRLLRLRHADDALAGVLTRRFAAHLVLHLSHPATRNYGPSAGFAM